MFISHTISVRAEYEVQSHDDHARYQNLYDGLLGVFCHLLLISSKKQIDIYRDRGEYREHQEEPNKLSHCEV